MKLIASDFDGTLIRGGIISDRDRAAIASWREAGNLFGIVTGRGGELPEFVTRELGLAIDFAVCGSGSMIFDGTPALVEFIVTPEDTAALLEDEARAHNAINWGRARCDKITEGFCQFSTLMKDSDSARAYADAVNEKYPQVNAFQNGRCVDVVKKGISKATGIARVAELFGVPADEIYPVGDSFNDLPMIEAYGGYAIAGSAIADRAGKICADIAELCESVS